METQIEFNLIIRAYLRLLSLGDFKDIHTESAQSQLSTMRNYIAKTCGESDQLVQELFELGASNFKVNKNIEKEIENILKQISPMRQNTSCNYNPISIPLTHERTGNPKSGRSMYNTH